MTADAATVRTPGDATAPATPQLRTLLLTDLCDSTTLVERLGDGPAARLFREHDALVLDLQQRWRGRLIDRSDGLLLLFERPIDGLGFALDYTRGLRSLGEAHKVPLQARAGLHVGEVLTWRNSDAAVAVGAKPLEVEGLAKPMAGRLMALARPGQLLLSAVAEPLARRAARELGERGDHLLWKSWGRWRFKGVPEAQELYEVGEPGIAPLRAPKAGAKAWRDIPLWRRPAALAAEALVLLGIATGAWFATRPEPAIAFNQRDWVVVGDLRNLTGDKLLDDSLEQAFRISLEQSRYVNVLSDLKARDTLALMQRQPGTALDRTIASEIALRDGARAVILPTVAEAGGKVRVSAEVIDPHTQTTVYAESADGTGAASTLGSIDHVTAALRSKLGEALDSIEKTSAPLPQVSTGNLDALRAYALGLEAYGKNRYADALNFFLSATQLDPNFALAWLGQAKAHFAVFDVAGGLPALHRAQTLSSRLAPREALYLDGWASEFEAPKGAADKWRLMSQMYPDYAPAAANTAIRLLHMSRFSEAVPFAARATMRQYESNGNAHDLLGRAYLALGDFKNAAREFDVALSHGNRDSWDKRAMVDAADHRFDRAQKWLTRAPADAAPEVSYYRALFSVDRGEWRTARGYAKQALEGNGKTPGLFGLSLTYALAVTEWLDGDTKSARMRSANLVDQSLAVLKRSFPADAQEVAGITLSSALLSQRLGDQATVDKVLAANLAKAPVDLPDLIELQAVLKAGRLVREGNPTRAIESLKPFLTGHERFQTHVALFDAYQALNQSDEAHTQARWLAEHRGLAYGELGCYGCQKTLNVADVGRALTYLQQLGRPKRQ
ncbi:MAG: putative peptide modification system cyclase [Lysobacter sp.]|nr:putative peptide modification system cyclase [Lysobacter sp.]